MEADFIEVESGRLSVKADTWADTDGRHCKKNSSEHR